MENISVNSVLDKMDNNTLLEVYSEVNHNTLIFRKEVIELLPKGHIIDSIDTDAITFDVAIKILYYIYDKIGLKECTRYHNRFTMNDEEFEEFWK